jgi:hypothetical protein
VEVGSLLFRGGGGYCPVTDVSRRAWYFPCLFDVWVVDKWRSASSDAAYWTSAASAWVLSCWYFDCVSARALLFSLKAADSSTVLCSKLERLFCWASVCQLVGQKSFCLLWAPDIPSITFCSFEISAFAWYRDCSSSEFLRACLSFSEAMRCSWYKL